MDWIGPVIAGLSGAIAAAIAQLTVEFKKDRISFHRRTKNGPNGWTVPAALWAPSLLFAESTLNVLPLNTNGTNSRNTMIALDIVNCADYSMHVSED